MADYYYRRRSIFGGFIIILIGVVLLLHEYYPQLGIGPVFERYWPLLLILWGVALLFDYLFGSRGGGRAPMVAGSEVALIIVLLVVVAALAGIDWAHRHGSDFDFDMDGMFDHPYSWKSDLTAVPAKPNGSISITTDRGDITVNPASDAKLHVTVDKTARASSEDEARKSADNVGVNITPSGNGYQIQSQSQNSQDVEDTDVRTDLDVLLPAQSAITAQTNHGDIKLAGTKGPITIDSKSGDLDLHDVAGDVDATLSHGDTHIDTVKGNVRLSGQGSEVDLSDVSGDATIQGEFYGPVRAHNIAKTTRYTSSITDLTLGQLSGEMELDSDSLNASDVNGSLTLRTENKDITLDNISGRIDLTDKHGDISLHFAQAPRDDIRIADDSANIDITLPAHSNFTISATSRNGEIDNEFENPGLKSSTSGETTVLAGSYGAGGPHITLSTTYGTITIHKAE